jgi:hypothetical protein
MLRGLKISTLLVITLLFFSCKKKSETQVVDTSRGTYFSIKGFIRDQWETFSGQPYLLNRFTTIDGKVVDSTLISGMKLEWSTLFKTFFETDISDPKFLEKYQFENFLEDATQTRTFSYTAINPELFTQKLQLTIDNYTGKIRNIYIETQKSSFWSKQSQKLLYTPVRVIQIQEHNEPLIGSNKDKIVEYKFL